MAKPDTEDGWFKLAHELDAALTVANFTKAEAVVLREVRAQIFWPSLQKTAELSPTDIERRSKVKRESISRAIAGLVKGETLERVGDRYRFIKDYERWTSKDAKRLTPAEVEYCRKSRPKRKSSSMGSAPSGDPQDRDSLVTPTVTNESHPCDQRVTVSQLCTPETVTNESRNRDQRVTPTVTNESRSRARALEERAELDLRESEKEEDDEDACEANASQSTPKIPTTPAELEAWAMAVIPEIENFGGKATQFARSYPIDWVHDAILFAATIARPGHLAGYTNSCLIRWKRRGGPPLDEIERSKAAAPFTQKPAAPVRETIAERQRTEQEARKASIERLIGRKLKS